MRIDETYSLNDMITDQNKAITELISTCFNNQNKSMFEYTMQINNHISTCTKEITDKLDQIICSQVSID